MARGSFASSSSSSPKRFSHQTCEGPGWHYLSKIKVFAMLPTVILLVQSLPWWISQPVTYSVFFRHSQGHWDICKELPGKRPTPSNSWWTARIHNILCFLANLYTTKCWESLPYIWGELFYFRWRIPYHPYTTTIYWVSPPSSTSRHICVF